MINQFYLAYSNASIKLISVIILRLSEQATLRILSIKTKTV